MERLSVFVSSRARKQGRGDDSEAARTHAAWLRRWDRAAPRRISEAAKTFPKSFNFGEVRLWI